MITIGHWIVAQRIQWSCIHSKNLKIVGQKWITVSLPTEFALRGADSEIGRSVVFYPMNSSKLHFIDAIASTHASLEKNSFSWFRYSSRSSIATSAGSGERTGRQTDGSVAHTCATVAPFTGMELLSSISRSCFRVIGLRIERPTRAQTEWENEQPGMRLINSQPRTACWSLTGSGSTYLRLFDRSLRSRR